MIRGIRSIIKLVSQEVQIPPQYLYGIIMALSEDEEYPHVYIAYDNKTDDYVIGVSKIKCTKKLFRYGLDMSMFSINL